MMFVQKTDTCNVSIGLEGVCIDFSVYYSVKIQMRNVIVDLACHTFGFSHIVLKVAHMYENFELLSGSSGGSFLFYLLTKLSAVNISSSTPYRLIR